MRPPVMVPSLAMTAPDMVTALTCGCGLVVGGWVGVIDVGVFGFVGVWFGLCGVGVNVGGCMTGSRP